MSTALTIETRVNSLETAFNQVNNYQVSFKKEALFAMQLLKGNDFLLKTAQNKPDSLENAIMNIAAIGITLNPAQKEAYLVPRGGQVCLDISYMGLIKLATDSGSVSWVQADIVRKNDVFEYLGVGQKPAHRFDPFGDRGEMVGAYCVAKLNTGDFLTTIMSKAEIEEIKNKTSQAKSGPWQTFFEEMAKKTVIKRAAKLWPKSERVQEAVEILNQHEGIDFSKGAHVEPARDGLEANEDTFSKLRGVLVAKGRTEDKLLGYINTQFKTEITTIEEMTPEMIESALRVMGA